MHTSSLKCKSGVTCVTYLLSSNNVYLQLIGTQLPGCMALSNPGHHADVSRMFVIFGVWGPAGDVYDAVEAMSLHKRPAYDNMTAAELGAAVGLAGHCSAIIKVTRTNPGWSVKGFCIVFLVSGVDMQLCKRPVEYKLPSYDYVHVDSTGCTLETGRDRLQTSVFDVLIDGW
jgi:hypothetical protein